MANTKGLRRRIVGVALLAVAILSTACRRWERPRCEPAGEVARQGAGAADTAAELVGVAQVGSPDELTMRNVTNLLAAHGIQAGQGAYSLVATMVVARRDAARAIALLQANDDIRRHAMSIGWRSSSRTTMDRTVTPVGAWLGDDRWPADLPAASLLRRAAQGRTLPLLLRDDLWIHEVEWESRVFIRPDGTESPAFEVDIIASATPDETGSSHREQLWEEDGVVRMGLMFAED